MKPVVVLLFVACIATSGRADSDPVAVNSEEKDSSLHFTQEMCPTEYPRLFTVVNRLGRNCINLAVGNDTALKDEITLENIRVFFGEFCQKKQTVRQCFLETTTQIEVCHNEKFLNTFKIYHDMIDNGLEFGCSEDGGRLSNLVYEVINLKNTNMEGFQSAETCFLRCDAMMHVIEESEVDIAALSYNLKNVIANFAECLQRDDINQSLKDLLNLLFDGLLQKMKCVHPQAGVLIPCVEIDAGLFSVTNVCDLKTYGTNMSLYDSLEEDFGRNTMTFFQHQDSEINDDDSVRHFVEEECRYVNNVFYSYNLSKTNYKTCFNDTQQKEFHLLGDVVKSGLEAACRENGTLLEKMMIGVYRLKNSGHGNAVWDCIEAVRSARNELNVHTSSSKNMRFYHELESFKGCLVNKLGDDVTSVAAATSLIDETMKAAKCVHPEDGTTMLCETLHVKA